MWATCNKKAFTSWFRMNWFLCGTVPCDYYQTHRWTQAAHYVSCSTTQRRTPIQSCEKHAILHRMCFHDLKDKSTSILEIVMVLHTCQTKTRGSCNISNTPKSIQCLFGYIDTSTPWSSRVKDAPTIESSHIAAQDQGPRQYALQTASALLQRYQLRAAHSASKHAWDWGMHRKR